MDRKNSEKTNNYEIWTGAIGNCLAFSEVAGKIGVPHVSATEFGEMTEMDLAGRTAFILRKFVGDSIPDAEGYIREVFSGFEEDPLPTVKMSEGLFISELNHGFSACSDDFVYALLPALVAAARKALSSEKDFIAVAAVKSAAVSKSVGADNLLVFYPERQIPELQKKLILGSDIDAYSVCGNYDNIQKQVERAVSALRVNGNDVVDFSLTCAGSVIILTACFFSAYVDLVSAEEISPGDVIDVFLPGSRPELVKAAQCAVKMGLPIGKTVFICVDGVGGFGVSEESDSEVFSYGEIKNAATDIFDEYGYAADPETIACLSAAEESSDENGGIAIVMSAANAFDYADEILDYIGEQKGRTPEKSLKKLENTTALPLPDSFSDAFVNRIREETKIKESDVVKIITDYVTSR